MPSKLKIQQTNGFTEGLNSDVADELLSNLAYRSALNIHVLATNAGQQGIVTNCLGTTEIAYDLPEGDNVCIASYPDTEKSNFYWINWNSNGFSGIYQYNTLLNAVIPIILNRTDTNGIDIFDFQEKGLVLHIDIVRSPTGDDLFYFAQQDFKAKKFNIQKALDKSTTGYGVVILPEYVNAYKLASIFPPALTYFTDTTRESNFLFTYLLKASVRHLYDDGEKNNWSEFSTVPLPLNEGFGGSTSVSNVNNGLTITVETGSSIVTQIEIAISISGEPFVSIIVLDKSRLGIADNTTYDYLFYNDNSSYSGLDQLNVYRAYSFLPLKPALQAFTKNSMVYGKGLEGFEAIDVDVATSVIYSDLFLPPAEPNELNRPNFLAQLLDYDFTKEGHGRRRNSLNKITIGADVKSGNKFELFGRNGASGNYYFTYTATLADDAVTVAAAIKQLLFATGNVLPDSDELPPTDIWVNEIDGLGNVSFEFIWRGQFNENVTTFEGRVNAVSTSSLKNNGQSVPTHKSGGTVKYGIIYWDEDTRRSNTYTSDSCVVRTDFVTQTDGFQQVVHQISVMNRPPVWAKYWELVRTQDLTYGNDFVQILIQKAIESQSTTTTDYVDLIIGSLYTYQAMYPNTVVTYEFEKNDRVRLMKKENSDTFYTFVETIVIDFKPVGTSEDVLQYAQTGMTSLVTVGGTTSIDNIGRYIVINDVERQIIAVPSGTTYTVDRPYGITETYPSYQIVDKRGILRVRQPIGVTIEDNSLVEVYKPTQNVESAQKNFYLFGQKFAITDWGTDLRAHTGNVQNQDPTEPTIIPAIVNIVKGTTYVRNRQLPTNNQIPGTQVIVDEIEDAGYSDFYVSDLNDNGKIAPEDEGAGQIRFGSRLRFSSNYIEGTRINGLNDFDNGNREDYNDPNGDIMLLKYREGLLYTFKQLRTLYIPILANIIVDEAGQEILGTSDKLLNKAQYFAWEGGIGNMPESYASDQTWQYFLSPNSGTDCRVGGNGILPISEQFFLDTKVKEYINNAVKYSSFVLGGFDRDNSERILAFQAFNIYLYNAGFDTANWELFHADYPEGTEYEITQQPQHGTVTIDSDGNFVYTPDGGSDGGYTGSDYFYYRWRVPAGEWTEPKRSCGSVTSTDIPPSPDIYYNAELTVYVTKDDCGEGYSGSSVPVTVEDMAFSSPFSQEDADQQAADYIVVNGQNIANDEGTCSTNDPTAFSFTDLIDLTPNTLTTSNTLILAGTFDTYRYFLTDVEIQINGGAWTDEDGTINVSDTFRIRRNSAAAYDTTVTGTLVIGTVSDTWSLTTLAGGTPDAAMSTLTPTSAFIAANGVSTQVLTVQAKDADGNNLVTGGATVTITKDSGTGTIGSITDNSDGTYTATVTSAVSAGSGLFSATLNASPVQSGLGSQTVSTITYQAVVSKSISWSNIQDLSPFVAGSFDYYLNGVLQWSQRGNTSGTITVNSGSTVKFIQNGEPVLCRWPTESEEGNSANMSVMNGAAQEYNNTVTTQSAELNVYEFVVLADGSYTVEMSTSSTVSGYSTYIADAESTIGDVQVSLTDTSSGNVELLIQDIPLTSEDYYFNVLTNGATITAEFTNHSGSTINATVTGVDTISITDGNIGSITGIPKGNVEIRITT